MRTRWVRGALAIDTRLVIVETSWPRAAALSITALIWVVNGLLVVSRRSAPSSARDSVSTESTMLARKELIATSAATPSVIELMYSPMRRQLERLSRHACFSAKLLTRRHHCRRRPARPRDG